MAGHLVTAGHTVAVHNRTTDVAERFRTDFPTVRVAMTPAEAAAGADIVFTIVGDDASVRSVILGDDGALAAMPRGSVLVDHTTATAEIALEIGTAATQYGVDVIDAPVSGGESGAQNGTLTVMCGGDVAAFDKVAPVMDAYSRTRRLIGTLGSGQRTKMVNQIAIAGVLQGLAEAINFGKAADLDMEEVLDTISAGAAGSWQMTNRGSTMVAGVFDFGFAIEWMVKDLRIALGEAERLAISLPIATCVAGYYEELMERGDRRSDTSALIKLLTDT